MKKIPLVIIALIIGLYACNSAGQNEQKEEKASLEKTIKDLQLKLARQDDVNKDRETAETLVAQSQLFAKEFPRDSMAAVYLFRAADVSRGLGDFTHAIALWGKVNQSFPRFKRAPDALFLQGFTYDRDLQNTEQAKKHYRLFLEKYPDHPMVPDVSLMLQYLEEDKSPEELIKEFKDKSGQ